MPDPMRFHLDENVDHAIAYGLRRHSIDVTVTSEVGLLHATDEEQLAFARDNARVIVTHDEDFLIMHSQGIPHAGISHLRTPDSILMSYRKLAKVLGFARRVPARVVKCLVV